MRATLPQVAQSVASDREFTLHAVRSGRRDVAFRATVAGKDGSGAPVEFDVAGDDGKLRAFKDADDFLKACGPIGLMSDDAATVTIDGLALVHAKPFTGDILKKNAATVAAYTKRVADGQARSTKIGQEIALLQADPSVPASYIAEKQLQRDTVDANVAWLQAEVTRLGGS